MLAASAFVAAVAMHAWLQRRRLEVEQRRLQEQEREHCRVITASVLSKKTMAVLGEDGRQMTVAEVKVAPVYLESGRATAVRYESEATRVEVKIDIREGCTDARKLNLAFREVSHHDEHVLGPTFSMDFDDKSQPALPVDITLKTGVDVRGKRVILSTSDGELVEEAYFSFDDPTVVRASTPHFSDFCFRVGDLDCTVKGLAAIENKQFSRSYGDWEDAKRRYQRGGMPYYLPYKFERVALDIPKSLNFPEDWVVGFHGTTLESAKNILRTGFLIPSKRGAAVRKGHIPLNLTVNGIANWADAIFFSPSYKYCMMPGYAGNRTPVAQIGKELFVASGSCIGDRVAYCILQCRIQKEALTVNPVTGKSVFAGTSGAWNDSDSRVPSTEMEYRVTNTSNILIYGVLYRMEPLHNVDSLCDPKHQ